MSRQHLELTMKVFLVTLLLSGLICAIDGQDDLDGLRKNIPGEPGKDYPIFSTNILCKINPRQCGGGGGGGNGNGRKNGGSAAAAGGNGRNGNGGQKRKNGANNGQRQQINNNQDRSNKANADFQAQIKEGKIPGRPGQDYPVASLAAFRKRPGFENIELAPDHLITPDYPGLGKTGSSGNGKRPNAAGTPRRAPAASNGGQNGGRQNGQQSYCPGSSIEECIRFCPSDESGSEYAACVTECGQNCQE